ncbi:MAG TPA: CHASE2 domain-containing protein, partial [Alphaproteobacteria bacterium]|nr:CHASE2 domain-containing protein [Alphaproteobacteria bacterium]
MTLRSSRTHQILILLLTTGALLSTWMPPGSRLESWSFRLAGWYAPSRPPASQVAVVGLDGATPQALRQQAASAIRRLHRLGAASVGLALPLDQPTTVEALADARRQAERIAADGAELRALRATLRELDADAALSDALRAAGNVVIAAYLHAQGPAVAWNGSPLAFLLQPPGAMRGVAAPLPGFRRDAAAVGVLDADQDAGIPVRVRAGAQSLPGVAAAMAARLDGASAQPVLQRVALTEAQLPDSRFYRHPSVRAADVVTFLPLRELAGGVDLARRPLLIGAARTDAERHALSELAASLAALLDGRGVVKPLWFHGALRAGVDQQQRDGAAHCQPQPTAQGLRQKQQIEAEHQQRGAQRAMEPERFDD